MRLPVKAGDLPGRITTVSKDVWMLGIGAGLVVDALASRCQNASR